MYPQENFAYHKRPFWPVLCLKRIGLPCCTFVTTTITCSLQIILLSNYSATYNFSTCRHYLTENYLSFPSAPRWVRHSYLSKRATIDTLYLWVIKAIYGTIAGEWSAFGKWNSVRKHLYSVLKFIHYKKKTHLWHFGPNEIFSVILMTLLWQ